MKAYNIKPQEKEFSWGKMKVIALGEAGRGRSLKYVPCEIKEVKDGDLVGVSLTRNKNIKLIPSSNDNGWITRINLYGGYTRNTYSYFCSPKNYSEFEEEKLNKITEKDEIIVLARGHGAFGMAGRIGRWNDYLLYVPEDTLIYCKTSGRGENYILHFMKKEVNRIPEREWEIYLDQLSESIPPIEEWEGP